MRAARRRQTSTSLWPPSRQSLQNSRHQTVDGRTDLLPRAMKRTWEFRSRRRGMCACACACVHVPSCVICAGCRKPHVRPRTWSGPRLRRTLGHARRGRRRRRRRGRGRRRRRAWRGGARRAWRGRRRSEAEPRETGVRWLLSERALRAAALARPRPCDEARDRNHREPAVRDLLAREALCHLEAERQREAPWRAMRTRRVLPPLMSDGTDHADEDERREDDVRVAVPEVPEHVHLRAAVPGASRGALALAASPKPTPRHLVRLSWAVGHRAAVLRW